MEVEHGVAWRGSIWENRRTKGSAGNEKEGNGEVVAENVGLPVGASVTVFGTAIRRGWNEEVAEVGEIGGRRQVL